MFEFMHKYRIPILLVVLLGLVGFGAWGAVSDLFRRDREDPLYGKFKVPGAEEEREVRWTEFRRNRIFVERYGRILSFRLGFTEQDPELLAWDFIVAKEAAKAAGVPRSPKDGENLYENTFGQFRSQNPNIPAFEVLPEEEQEFWRDVKVAERYLNVVQYGSMAGRTTGGAEPGGGDYASAFESYEDTHERLRMGLVLIPGKDADDYKLDMTKEEDKTKLLGFWKQNEARLKAAKPILERLTVEAVFVKHLDLDVPTFTETFNEKYAEATKDIEVTKDEILARWKANQEKYGTILGLETDRRAKQGANEGDQPSEFSIMEPRIEQELKLAKLFQKFAEEASKLTAAQSMEELAKKYGLLYEKLEDASTQELTSNPDFGKPRWVTEVMREGRDGTLKPGQVLADFPDPENLYVDGIFDQPGDMLAVIRPLDFKERREPELNDIRDFVIEEWQKEQAKKDRDAKATAYLDAVKAKVEVVPAVMKLKEEIDAEVKAAVDKFIEDEKLDREKDKAQIERYENSQRRQRAPRIEEEKGKHEKDVAMAVAKEQELEVLTSDWISTGPRQNGGQVTLSDDLSDGEVRRRLLRSSRRVLTAKGLQEGRLGTLEQEPAVNLGLIPILLEKRKPTVAEMLQDPGLPNLLRTASKQPAPFTYENLKNPAWFSLDATETEKALEEDRRKQAQKEARRQQRELRKRQQAAERRAANAPVLPTANNGSINPGTGEPMGVAPF